MYLLRLCETREYSPRMLEHWLHTIQKKKSACEFILQENQGKIELLCSENLENHLVGSRCQEHSTLSRATPKAAFTIHQAKGPLLPIKRHAQFEDRLEKTRIIPTDPLIKEMAKTAGAFIHFTWKPLKERARERVLKKAKAPHFEPERRFDQWESRGWLKLSARRLLGPLIRRMLHPPVERKHQEEQMESSHEREDPKRAVLDKLSRPLFQVEITLSHPFKEFWSGFTLPYLGALTVRRSSRRPSRLLLSAEELATMLTPPNAKDNAAELYTEPTAYLPAPSTNPLHMEEEDRKRHLYLVGKTGMGKSTTLLNLFEQDLAHNRSLILLDPHGDLVTDALRILPPEKTANTLLLDPSHTDFPLALNPVELHPGENPNLKTSALVEMFEVLSKGSWGPRLEYILRNALLLLTLAHNTTLLDLPLLLTSSKRAMELLAHVKDPELHRFFKKEFFAQDEKTRQEHSAPILNKVGPLLTTPLLRNIFGQPRGKFNFDENLEDKIILISLSKGKLGEDSSRLLGMIFVSMIQSALLRRAGKNAADRKTVCLYLDEFQNFATRTLLGMLAESRKYGLALTLANQYLTQVPPEIQDAVLGNAGSLIAFRTSYQDSQILAPSLGLMEEDLTHLAPFQAYARLLKNQSPLPLFRLETRAPTFQGLSPLASIQKRSLERYGRRASLVEEKILERYNKRK